MKECVLCGSSSIRSISKPLDHDEVEKLKWNL